MARNPGDKPDIQSRSFDFARRIVQLCQHLDAQKGVGRTIGWQLIRSGTSIGANCEEASAGHTKPDFMAKIGIALKEARETNYWLRLVSACKLVEISRLGKLIDESDQIKRILGAILASARRKPPEQD